MSCCPLCGSNFESADIIIMPERDLVMRGDSIAVLTGQEMLLFGRLVKSAPNLVSKESLLMHLYQLEQKEAEIKIIDVFVCKIRKKIGHLGVTINTVWGKGYAFQFEGPVKLVQVSHEPAL